MTQIRAALGVGETFFSAMKKAMGLREARMGFLLQFNRFLRENPTFKQSDVYHRPGCRCVDCVKSGSIPGGRKRGRKKSVVATV